MFPIATFKRRKLIPRALLAVIALAIIAAVAIMVGGCGHTTIASRAVVNGCGEFDSSLQGPPLGWTPGGQWKDFGEGCRDVQIARAESAYVQSQTAAAMWYVSGGDTAQRLDAVEGAVEGVIFELHPEAADDARTSRGGRR